MGIQEKIQRIEDEMKITQKNKNTEYHLGRLKAQLAKLRRELLDPKNMKSSGGGEGFAVSKFGNARVALVGFPSVGKSSLLSLLTKTESVISAKEFTTLTCIPGNLRINDANIQILDLPGIVEGAARGKGKGRQVLAVAKVSDLLLIVLDPLRGLEQKYKIEQELHAMGIRINKQRPDISLRKKLIGGINFTSTCKLTHVDEKSIKVVMQEYKIHNADIIFRNNYTIDDFIDIIEDNRKFIDAIFLYNKIDLISIEDVDEIAKREHSLVMSVQLNLNMDNLLKAIWDKLNLVRIYTKKKGQPPDFDDPIVLTKSRKGCTIRSVCRSIHKDFETKFKYAYIWGKSAKFSPQTCGLSKLKRSRII